MTIKMMVFDIDGTLAKTEECIAPHIADELRKMERKGIKIVLISGRTASYLAGLARGMGIKSPLVAGENGGVLFSPTDLWEKKLDEIPAQIRSEIKTSILDKFDNIWFQPNQTMVTVAPKDRTKLNEIYKTILQVSSVKENEYKLNQYDDAVEVMPKNNSKGRALAVIRDFYKLECHEIIAIGNTPVDLPMKTEAKEFIYIGDRSQTIVSQSEYESGRGTNGKDIQTLLYDENVKNYPCIEEALQYLETTIVLS